MCLPLSTAAGVFPEPGTPVLQTCSKAIINGVFTRFYYPPSVSKSAAPSSQKAGRAITTQQCQPQALSLPTLLNTNATLQWPGTHTNTPTVTLFILEKRIGTWYSYSLIINKSLRTVGNRWTNKMLWTLNLALACEQEQALRSWALCQGGLDTSCRCFDALIWLLAWFFVVKTRPSCCSQPHQLYHYPGKETAKHCPHIGSTVCLWPAGVFKAPDTCRSGKINLYGPDVTMAYTNMALATILWIFNAFVKTKMFLMLC